MKIAILGAGRRGFRLAKHLIEEKKDVVLIDDNPDVVNRVMTTIDCLAVEGDGTNLEDLKQAGLENADAFIALTGSDKNNLISCSLVNSEFKVPLTIASIRNLTIMQKNNGKNSIMGISHVVNPVYEVANHIYSSIERGVYSDTITFGNSTLALYNVYIEKKSKFAGKKIKNIRTYFPMQFIIAALSRNGHAIVPDGDTVIKEGDTLSICTEEDNVTSLLSSVGQKRLKTKKIGIVGGTKVTEHLIENFTASERGRITLIEKDKDLCERFATKFPDVLVLNDNITREGFFKEEDFADFDLFMSLSDSDELNIITSSYAKNLGVKISMALVSKNADYIRMASHLNIDSIISAQSVTVDSILRYLQGSNVSSIHSLFDGDIEAIEYKVESSDALCNKALKDIDMKGKAIIAGIIKTSDNRQETIIPNGNYVINDSDILLIVSERKSNAYLRTLLSLEKE